MNNNPQSPAGNNPPDGWSPSDGARNGSLGASVSYSGATELSSSTTVDSPSYSSSTAGENALLVTDGEITLNSPSVTKSGDESSENSDFYGTNAAVLVTDGTLTLNGGEITTDGAHANALFAYGGGAIVAENTKITTSDNNSGGVMVTGGGALTATNLSVSTSGNSSAAIRSDRGGGTMTLYKGDFTTSGTGSPAIYSTANITVAEGATLTSTSSEGVVIEGSNQVTLEDVTLTDTNTTLNGNSETYKNIFIYQSMSGDAEEGIGTFSATNSLITTNQGDSFFITNTTAHIYLTHNIFVNTDDGAFLRAQAGKWGTEGNNGGKILLSLNDQVVEGDIVLDSISSLDMSLTNESFFKGAINSENTSSAVALELDSTSTFVLTGNTFLSSLKNQDSENMNIYSNGYKLFVDGIEVSVNTAAAPAVPEVVLSAWTSETDVEVITTNTEKCLGILNGSCTEPKNLTILGVAGGSLLLLIICIVVLIVHGKKKNSVPPETPAASLPEDNPFRTYESTSVTVEETKVEETPQPTAQPPKPEAPNASSEQQEEPEHSEPDSPDFLK